MNPNRDTAGLIKQLFILFETMIPIFIMSLISEEIADQLESFDFYNVIIWYKLPSNMQRIMPFIIMHTQNPFVFELYGNVACNCETFKKVIIKSYKYIICLVEILSGIHT